MFSLLGRGQPDTEIVTVNSNSNEAYPSGIISSSDSMDMRNLGSSDDVDENLDSDFDELRTLSERNYEETNDLRFINLSSFLSNQIEVTDVVIICEVILILIWQYL